MAYVTGLAMRRAADLYAGAAKTDPKADSTARPPMKDFRQKPSQP